MAKSLARTFGQDLMSGEHVVGAEKSNGGVLMPSHSSGDPSFYAKKRAKEAELGHELTTEAFLADHYQASDAATASGTSIFDPVLCEIAYRWFCPQGGTVLDPFAGGSVRGIVASQLGRAYVGIELRAEQVTANQAQAALGAGPAPQWITGDSRDIATLAKGVDADLIFRCPPYWNLEVYSDDPADLSTLGKDAFFDAYARIIAGAISACATIGSLSGRSAMSVTRAGSSSTCRVKRSRPSRPQAPGSTMTRSSSPPSDRCRFAPGGNSRPRESWGVPTRTC